MNHPYLLAAGAILVVLGFLLTRWASRYDAAAIAADAAWRMAKTRSATGAKDEFGRVVDEQLREVKADAARIGTARTAIKHGSRFLAARVANMAGIVSMLAGVAAAALAFLWK